VITTNRDTIVINTEDVGNNICHNKKEEPQLATQLWYIVIFCVQLLLDKNNVILEIFVDFVTILKNYLIIQQDLNQFYAIYKIVEALIYVHKLIVMMIRGNVIKYINTIHIIHIQNMTKKI